MSKLPLITFYCSFEYIKFYQVLLDLREEQKIPVVLTAGVTERPEHVVALSDENYVFFPEPVDFSQLHQEIQKLLFRRHAVSAA